MQHVSWHLKLFLHSRILLRHKSKSSTRWVNRQKTDFHTIQSKQENYRSRAAFKLIEINDKFKILDGKSKNIVDLGFAPGAWTQVALAASKKKNTDIKVLGVDLIDCSPPEGASFIQGDIFSKQTHEKIINFFQTDENLQPSLDLVLSDMMTNTSGMGDNDHYASMDLCDGVLVLACRVLKKNGNLVMKFYTGKEDKSLEEKLKKLFHRVHRMKPTACRKESREMYFVGLKKRSQDTVATDIFS